MEEWGEYAQPGLSLDLSPGWDLLRDPHLETQEEGATVIGSGGMTHMSEERPITCPHWTQKSL